MTDITIAQTNSPPLAAAAADVSAAVANNEPRKLDTPEAVFAEILERAELESITDIETTRDAWVVDPSTGKRVRVELGKASPFKAQTEVIGVFHDELSARIYTSPAPKTEGVIERWKFTTVAVSCATLSVEQFVDAMAVEYRILAGDDDDDDDDDETTT
jgi:hypothetical protein